MVERKCKGCGAPVKGHKGPTGAGRCQNEPVGSDPVDNSTLEQTKVIDAEVKTEDESVNVSADANTEDTTEKEEKKESKAGKTARGRSKKKPAAETTEDETIDQEDEVKAATDEKEIEEVFEKNDDTKKTGKTARGKAKKKPETEIAKSTEDMETENVTADNTNESIEDSKDDTTKEEDKKEVKSKASKTSRGRTKKKPDSDIVESNEKEEEKDNLTNNGDEIEENIEDSKTDPIKEDKKESKAKAGLKGGRGRAKKKQEIIDEEKENTNEGSNEKVDDGSNQELDEPLKETKGKAAGKSTRGRQKKKSSVDEQNDSKDMTEDTRDDIADQTADTRDDIADQTEDNTDKSEDITDKNEDISDNKEKVPADEELANNDTENTHTENLVDADSSMEENKGNTAAKGKKKIGKATVKSKKTADKKVLKDITNASAEANNSIDAEMEGTFVVDKVINNNDDSIQDSENKKKPTKKQQSRRRTFVIDETPDLAESTTISVIQEGDGTDEENAGIPNNIDMDWTLNLSIDKETDWKRERLYSKSDFSFDVRPYLIGKQFLLCGCNYYDDGDEPFMCDCDAVIHFDKKLTGSVADVFYNPLNDEEDLKPAFRQDLQSWNSDRPNLLKCEFTKVKNRQITSVQGEIHITGERCVEIEKGRKIRCMFFMAEMDLSINGSKPFLTKLNKTRLDSIGNPIKFRKIKFDMISHEAKLSEDSNETGLCGADESIVSKSADMTETISEVAEMTGLQEEGQ